MCDAATQWESCQLNYAPTPARPLMSVASTQWEFGYTIAMVSKKCQTYARVK